MVIPVHDVNPVRRTPWITYGLIAANVVVFLRMPAAAHTLAGNVTASQLCQLQAFVEHWGAVPRELILNRPPGLVPVGQVGIGPHGVGCLLGPRPYGKPPALSVLTAMFVHGSWLHLLGNMLFLWIFGNNIEDRMGRLRYLLFYLVCGYAAGYGFALTDPASTQPLVGASGAIAGVLGAYLVLYPRARVWSLVPFLFFIPLRLPAWLILGMWFVLQALYSTGNGVATGAEAVAYIAHVIGFIVGLLIALPLRPGTPPPPVPRRRSQAHHT
ncbi:rhomboid family intramembrane serine protease [Streptomyces sp. RB6PN25]|uniref:Rhomboid family intramembrane serine protease n=1 Tax=Streptomyces humicola TaxID=2953240 RepID=A0ABT1Q207_9ACTN|nr:rhomboid family intramembrane serine protease [Streptomyces humicola]MCQ4083968.1 rhomboid family intramembrane serine protease [Streptomyces humicola]